MFPQGVSSGSTNVFSRELRWINECFLKGLAVDQLTFTQEHCSGSTNVSPRGWQWINERLLNCIALDQRMFLQWTDECFIRSNALYCIYCMYDRFLFGIALNRTFPKRIALCKQTQYISVPIIKSYRTRIMNNNHNKASWKSSQQFVIYSYIHWGIIYSFLSPSILSGVIAYNFNL